MRKLQKYLDDKKKEERRLWDWIRDISKSESDKARDDQWKRWKWRGVSLVLVLIVVVLFAWRLYTNQPKCGQSEVSGNNLALLIAWKDFLVGAVVVAFIWLVRSLWE